MHILAGLLFYGFMISLTMFLIFIEDEQNDGFDACVASLFWPITIWFIIGIVAAKKVNKFVKFLNKEYED